MSRARARLGVLALGLATIAWAPPDASHAPAGATFALQSTKGPPHTLHGAFCRTVGPAPARVPGEATDHFGDDATEIDAVFWADEPVHAKASFVALDAPGAAKGILGWAFVSVAPGSPDVLTLAAPRAGFFPGRYALLVEVEGSAAQTVPFTITPSAPPASPVGAIDAPAADGAFAIDVARAAFGATITSDVPKVKPATLIDGIPYRNSADAVTIDPARPATLTIDLPGAQAFRVVAITLDNTDAMTGIDPRNKSAQPKLVEISTSATEAGDDFDPIGAGRLENAWGEQRIDVTPTLARRVRLRIVSNYGARWTSFSAVRVLASDADAFVASRSIDLASPALGGRVSSFDEGGRSIGELCDGISDKANGWTTRASSGELPQTFVFSFDRGQRALVESVVIHADGAGDAGPRVVAVALSDTSPIDGFTEVARPTLPKSAGPHTIPIGREARFVALRVVANHGSKITQLSEVEILEGHAPGYTSVLLRAHPDDGSTTPLETIALSGTVEVEPDDDRAHAIPLAFGATLQGSVAGADVDVVHVTMPFAGTLTLALSGAPDIRTTLSLFDAKGLIGRRDPGERAPYHQTFTWPVAAGDHWLQVERAPISVVLVWDTSGSMANATGDLERAVNAYVESVPAGERVGLVRFAQTVEPVLPDFTSDRAVLHAALRGKFWADGGTALYDALAKAIDLLGDAGGQRAIILMTDGSDSASRLSSGALWQLVADTRIPIYAIGLGRELHGYSPITGASGDHMLIQLTHATGGKVLFTDQSAQLAEFYRMIAAELRAPARWSLSATASRAQGTLAVVAPNEPLAAVASAPNVLVVLDASGSMKRPIRSSLAAGAMAPMIDVAKRALSDLIASLPDATHVGLRVYGHRRAEGTRDACTDTELMVPLGPLDRTKLTSRIAGVSALGTTPIAYALAQTASDLKGVRGEPMIVLVTDGREECHGDPQKELMKLRAAGIKPRLEVIGFALHDLAAAREMTALAESTGGRYRPAADAVGLATSLKEALTVHWHVHDASGVERARGEIGQAPVSLPEGHYRLVVDVGGRPVVLPDVEVETGRPTRVALHKEGSRLVAAVTSE